MPNIKPNSILKLEKFMRKNKCDIGTLASNPIKDKKDIDPNIVKVQVQIKNLRNDSFF